MVKMTGALAAVKKNMLDKMVPILATLKGTLEEAMHPLQRDTLNCLVRLYTEHRPDMEELLVNRSQLAAEIRYNAQVSGYTPTPEDGKPVSHCTCVMLVGS